MKRQAQHAIRARRHDDRPAAQEEGTFASAPETALVLAIVACLAWGAAGRNRLYADPLSLWEDTVAKSPLKARVHYNLGTFYYHRGRMDDAVGALRRATELKPDHVRAHFNLGMAYVRRGDLEEAVRSFQAALRGDPQFTDAHFNIGSAYYLQNKLKDAAESFRKVVQVEERNVQARINLGQTYVRLGLVSEARREFERVLQIQPGYAEAAAELHALRSKSP